MKIQLIVEGDSDKIILEAQRKWIESFGCELDDIIVTEGKPSMIKKVAEHYNVAMIRKIGRVIFLPDQDDDNCALVTRKNIGVDYKPKADCIVLKLALEAWILADKRCIQNCIANSYHLSRNTDNIKDPKDKLLSILRRVYIIDTSVEIADIVATHFSIDRATNYNTSAKRFKDYLKNIS